MVSRVLIEAHAMRCATTPSPPLRPGLITSAKPLAPATCQTRSHYRPCAWSFFPQDMYEICSLAFWSLFKCQVSEATKRQNITQDGKS